MEDRRGSLLLQRMRFRQPFDGVLDFLLERNGFDHLGVAEPGEDELSGTKDVGGLEFEGDGAVRIVDDHLTVKPGHFLIPFLDHRIAFDLAGIQAVGPKNFGFAKEILIGIEMIDRG